MAFPASEQLVRAILTAGVRDERVIAAFREVPRALFVPSVVTGRAYADQPLPIPHGQVTTQPSLVAKMVEAVRVDPSDIVLEIGTGYGFQTAVLSRLAREVFSIERYEDFADVARGNLERIGAQNVHVTVGDGSCGLPEHAPYDAIVVSAAYPGVPNPLVEQLADGGRLVQPIGPGGAEDVRLFCKHGKDLVDSGSIIGAYFVKLYGRHGFAENED